MTRVLACPACVAEIVTFLRRGETARCPACGAATLVREDARESERWPAWAGERLLQPSRPVPDGRPPSLLPGLVVLAFVVGPCVAWEILLRTLTEREEVWDVRRVHGTWVLDEVGSGELGEDLLRHAPGWKQLRIALLHTDFPNGWHGGEFGGGLITLEGADRRFVLEDGGGGWWDHFAYLAFLRFQEPDEQLPGWADVEGFRFKVLEEEPARGAVDPDDDWLLVDLRRRRDEHDFAAPGSVLRYVRGDS